jgi:DNA-binding response OmpR family regulator
MKNSGTDVKRILVVEDEPAISQFCQRVLTGEGFEVDIAGNGDIAQDMLRKRDYTLCVVDIRTPVMNGKQLYQHMIDKHPELANRVIFSTGDMMDGYTYRFLELAGRPFLAKPFTPAELKITVREALRQIEK